MKNNQTHIFIAATYDTCVGGYTIHGVELTLEGAVDRFTNKVLKERGEAHRVIECPVGSPFDFKDYDPKHGYRVYSVKDGKITGSEPSKS
jgi:hypothetical protein